MKRTIATSTVDVAVVGGGIQGATIACRVAQAGFSVALFDKGDFAAATSANSLKIIHGGIRYLQHGNIKRIRESIRCRREMMRLFPHLTRPLPCLMPVYGHGLRGRETMRLAFAFYDLIAFDRNRGLTEKKCLPPTGWLSPVNTAATIPGLASAGLTGSALWYDTLATNTERLTLEYIKMAARHGAMVANYCEATEPLIDHGRLHGFYVRDILNGAEHKVNCRLLVNAACLFRQAGPWLERLAGSLSAMPAQSDAPPPRWATAINLVVKKRFFGDYAVGLEGPDSFADPYSLVPRGKRLFFFVPWRGAYTMIGTNYGRWAGTGDFVAEALLSQMLADINRIYPAAALKPEDVSFFHAGLLPIAAGDDGLDPMPELETKGRFIDHAEDGAAGLVSVNGVKYTTAPALASQLLRYLEKNHLAGLPRENRYQATGREKPDFAAALAALGSEYEKIEAHLMEGYGESWRDVFRYVASKPTEAAEPWLIPGLLRAELRYFIHEEMAITLADVVFRRTGLASAECPSEDVLRALAETMGAELAWDEAESERQIQAVLAVFAPLKTLRGGSHV